MNIPVLIEPIANNGFRATGGLPFEITVEGATRDEALGRLRPRSTSEWPGRNRRSSGDHAKSRSQTLFLVFHPRRETKNKV